MKSEKKCSSANNTAVGAAAAAAAVAAAPRPAPQGLISYHISPDTKFFLSSARWQSKEKKRVQSRSKLLHKKMFLRNKKM